MSGIIIGAWLAVALVWFFTGNYPSANVNFALGATFAAGWAMLFEGVGF